MTDRFMSAADFRAAMALLHERGISANELHKIFECGRSAALARRAMSRWLWPQSCEIFPHGRRRAPCFPARRFTMTFDTRENAREL
jgi:hypothetical protein